MMNKREISAVGATALRAALLPILVGNIPAKSEGLSERAQAVVKAFEGDDPFGCQTMNAYPLAEALLGEKLPPRGNGGLIEGVVYTSNTTTRKFMARDRSTGYSRGSADSYSVRDYHVSTEAEIKEWLDGLDDTHLFVTFYYASRD